MLTASEVRGLRAPGKYRDGHGLILHVVSAAKRYWVFRYVRDGRERSMSLGNADVLSLADARRLHMEARTLLAQGSDPLDAREAAKAAAAVAATKLVTFGHAADAYIEAHRAGWRGERTAGHWGRSLTTMRLRCSGQSRSPTSCATTCSRSCSRSGR